MKRAITPLRALKSPAESYVQAYIDTYGLRAASFRLPGLHGPRQFGGEDHGWIALFVIRAILGVPINTYRTGKQIRDPLYANDVAEAVDAFYRVAKPGVHSVGGEVAHSLSLLECTGLIDEITGKEATVEHFVCDITKARRELGWGPRIPPREGVRRLALS